MLSPDSPFARLPHSEREAIIGFVSATYGWDDTRAVRELEQMNHIGLASLKRDMRSAEGCGGHFVDYDPGAEMFKPR